MYAFPLLVCGSRPSIPVPIRLSAQAVGNKCKYLWCSVYLQLRSHVPQLPAVWGKSFGMCREKRSLLTWRAGFWFFTSFLYLFNVNQISHLFFNSVPPASVRMGWVQVPIFFKSKTYKKLWICNSSAMINLSIAFITYNRVTRKWRKDIQI